MPAKKILNDSSFHLTYCLNIHPGETWQENFHSIRNEVLEIKKKVAPDREFGLGLRLSFIAASELQDEKKLDEFRDFLTDNGLYAFTINGFPYGGFHGVRVKEKVYAPDWRSTERRDYTKMLANILAALLPPKVTGSISTVPGSYREWIKTGDDLKAMCSMLADTAFHLFDINKNTGKYISLGLEPEPDCFLENTDDAVKFFSKTLPRHARKYLVENYKLDRITAGNILRKYLGICLDTAHVAVAYENPAKSLLHLQNADINVAKVQLSAALSMVPDPKKLQRLKAFSDKIYLHQFKAKTDNGEIISYPDLPVALEEFEKGKTTNQVEWRVHFHVPLFVKDYDGLYSTSPELDKSFFNSLKTYTGHVEIETYTFNVIPEPLRPDSVIVSIVSEFNWLLAKVAP